MCAFLQCSYCLHLVCLVRKTMKIVTYLPVVSQKYIFLLGDGFKGLSCHLVSQYNLISSLWL
uniref:Uncharacterized protein n=1 Tax=Arundo donax TaxID=35708 RepID=A0A0A9A400_ARUDO